MNDLEVLVENKTIISIAGKPYSVGKLSLKQFVELSRFFVEVAGKLPKGIASTDSNVADFIFLVQELDEPTAGKLFAIILQEPDAAFIANHVLADMELCSDILAAVCEHNDFAKIFSNFQKAAERIKKAGTPASLPS
jgi:ssDNA-specific exonuclease RecJ